MPALNVLKKWLPHGTRLAHWPSQGWLLETWDSPCFYQYLHLGYSELGFTKILTGLKILTGEVGLNFEASLQLCLFLRGQLYPMLFCLSVMKDVDIRRLFPGLSVLFHPSECYTWTARSTGRCKSAWHVQAREQAPLSSHLTTYLPFPKWRIKCSGNKSNPTINCNGCEWSGHAQKITLITYRKKEIQRLMSDMCDEQIIHGQTLHCLQLTEGSIPRVPFFSRENRNFCTYLQA